jgi:preprotein translocase subunit SecG
MDIIKVIIEIILIITSLFLILLVLMHKAKGNGLSDLFGGGLSQSMGSSGVASRNLDRITVVMSVLWTLSIVILGIIIKG